MARRAAYSGPPALHGLEEVTALLGLCQQLVGSGLDAGSPDEPFDHLLVTWRRGRAAAYDLLEPTEDGLVERVIPAAVGRRRPTCAAYIAPAWVVARERAPVGMRVSEHPERSEALTAWAANREAQALALAWVERSSDRAPELRWQGEPARGEVGEPARDLLGVVPALRRRLSR